MCGLLHRVAFASNHSPLPQFTMTEIHIDSSMFAHRQDIQYPSFPFCPPLTRATSEPTSFTMVNVINSTLKEKFIVVHPNWFLELGVGGRSMRLKRGHWAGRYFSVKWDRDEASTVIETKLPRNRVEEKVAAGRHVQAGGSGSRLWCICLENKSSCSLGSPYTVYTDEIVDSPEEETPIGASPFEPPLNFKHEPYSPSIYYTPTISFEGDNKDATHHINYTSTISARIQNGSSGSSAGTSAFTSSSHSHSSQPGLGWTWDTVDLEQLLYDRWNALPEDGLFSRHRARLVPCGPGSPAERRRANEKEEIDQLTLSFRPNLNLGPAQKSLVTRTKRNSSFLRLCKHLGLKSSANDPKDGVKAETKARGATL